jgi:hypothetical protein
LEPLQEKETYIILELEEEKTRMAQEHTESATLFQEHITTQMVGALEDKAAQVKEKGKELEEKFHKLEKAIQREHTT